jgi:hypothetical protein
MPTCSASASELALYIAVRGKAFYKRTFFTCQCVTTLFVVLLPLFVTNTPSYGAAGKVCYDRNFMRLNVTNVNSWDLSMRLNSWDYDPEWDMEDNASWGLLPMHLFNSISTVVSLFGFGVWLFFSPHMANVARDLDRTCTTPIACLKNIQAATF